jgi:hypothetical protein
MALSVLTLLPPAVVFGALNRDFSVGGSVARSPGGSTATRIGIR